MTKRRREPVAGGGERLLAEWGAAGEADARALGALIGRDAAADLAIAARLGDIADPDSAALLQRLERETSDRAVRKEAKRALYRLQQRGVAIEPAAPAPAPTALLGPALEGWISAVDGRGDQMAWILRPRPDSVLHFFAIFNDPDGLREVSVSPITRRSLREIRAELEARHELRLVECDWHWVDFLVARAHRWTRERGGRVEGDYLALRSQIAHAPPPEEMENPVWQRVDRAEVGPGVWLESSAEILAEPELRSWLPDPQQIAPFLEALDNIRNSPLVLNRVQQEERLEAVMGEAIDKVYGAAGPDSWRRRLEQLAYFFAVTRRLDSARRAAGAAAGLQRGLPFAEIPLLATLLRAALDAYFKKAVQAEAEREESSLIVTPGQVRKRTP